MSIESGPKPTEDSEIPKTESKKERIELSFDAIRDIITSQIGNKAEIDRLEIEAAAEGAKLNAEIDAGMLGGRISLEGFIVNTTDGIAIRDLNIDARGYVKSRIENNLSKFESAIRKYLEKQYGKSISSIQIINSGLVIELGDSLADEATGERTKTELEKIIGYIESEKDPMYRWREIKGYAEDFMKKKRFDDAREIVKLLKNEEGRRKSLAYIDRIEKESK